MCFQNSVEVSDGHPLPCKILVDCLPPLLVLRLRLLFQCLRNTFLTIQTSKRCSTNTLTPSALKLLLMWIVLKAYFVHILIDLLSTWFFGACVMVFGRLTRVSGRLRQMILLAIILWSLLISKLFEPSVTKKLALGAGRILLMKSCRI